MCKNSIHTTGAAASAVNELCTDRGSVCVTNSESTHDEPLYCRISTQKAIYKIPYQDILFIESEQKKSVIHLLKKTICVSVPLYRILEVLPKETFVQTHRSFIVNLKNASSIDPKILGRFLFSVRSSLPSLGVPSRITSCRLSAPRWILIQANDSPALIDILPLSL